MTGRQSTVFHDPAQVVAGTVVRQPEGPEATVVVQIPLASSRSAMLHICGVTTRLEALSRAIVVGKVCHCQRRGDVFDSYLVAVFDVQIFQRWCHPLLLTPARR